MYRKARPEQGHCAQALVMPKLDNFQSRVNPLIGALWGRLTLGELTKLWRRTRELTPGCDKHGGDGFTEQRVTDEERYAKQTTDRHCCFTTDLLVSVC